MWCFFQRCWVKKHWIKPSNQSIKSTMSPNEVPFVPFDLSLYPTITFFQSWLQHVLFLLFCSCFFPSSQALLLLPPSKFSCHLLTSSITAVLLTRASSLYQQLAPLFFFLFLLPVWSSHTGWSKCHLSVNILSHILIQKPWNDIISKEFYLWITKPPSKIYGPPLPVTCTFSIMGVSLCPNTINILLV